jgi:segregation and condensation protein A
LDRLRKGFERLSRAGKTAAALATGSEAEVETVAEAADAKIEVSEEETALTDRSPENDDVAAEVTKTAEVEAGPKPETFRQAHADAPVDAEAGAASTPESVHEGLNPVTSSAEEPPIESPAQREYETADATAPDEIEEEEAVEALVEASPVREPEDRGTTDAKATEAAGEAQSQIESNQGVAGTETVAAGEIGSGVEGDSHVSETEAAAEMNDAAASETGPMQQSAGATIAQETVLPAVARPQPIEPKAPGEESAQLAPAIPERSREQKTADKVTAALKARGEDAEQSPFSVNVARIYDGPLDLLLDLIRKQDIDIYDIPIAKITAQFLAYVDQLKSTDVDVAGEFIYTASLLIHIKSRMLLPRIAAGPEDAAEDPRRELVERLLEHERFKSAAQMLQQKQMLEAATWTNPGMREFREDGAAEPEIAADTVDLVRVFREILERARNRPVLKLEEDSVTVGQMIQFLSRRLTMEDKPVSLRKLLAHTRSERALIAMFLALLELVRLQAILLRQDLQFSEIFIKKHTGFEAVMNQGLANARDDWR